MASERKIMEILTLISTIYSNFARGKSEKEMNVLLNTWGKLLKNYSDNEVEFALEEALSTCQFAPTPADIIENIKKARKSLSPSDEELWSIYENALRKTCDQVGRFTYTIRESNGLTQGQNARNRVDKIFEELPPKVKAYVSSKGELINQAIQWGEKPDFSHFEKPRFMKAMPNIEEQIEYRNNPLLSNQSHHGELSTHCE